MGATPESSSFHVAPGSVTTSTRAGALFVASALAAPAIPDPLRNDPAIREQHARLPTRSDPKMDLYGFFVDAVGVLDDPVAGGAAGMTPTW